MRREAAAPCTIACNEGRLQAYVFIPSGLQEPVDLVAFGLASKGGRGIGVLGIRCQDFFPLGLRQEQGRPAGLAIAPLHLHHCERIQRGCQRGIGGGIA